MAISDLAIKAASESAVIAVERHLSQFKTFAHNFSPESGVHYGAVAVPVYNLSASAEFVEGTKDWCNGANSLDGAVITLEKHYINTIQLPDTVNGEADINFVRDGAAAIAGKLALDAEKYVYSKFTTDNTVSATMPTTKAAFAGLMKVCDDNGIDPYQCTLVLNAESFGSLMSTLDANVYGGPEAIRNGMIEGLYGFKAVQMTGALPTGMKGLIVPYGVAGVVTRVNKPAINGYDSTWTVEDPNGIGIGFRSFEHQCFGKALLGGDILVGAAVLQSGKAVRLV
jgi:hypothetical protein